jgi:hypothetical protein
MQVYSIVGVEVSVDVVTGFTVVVIVTVEAGLQTPPAVVSIEHPLGHLPASQYVPTVPGVVVVVHTQPLVVHTIVPKQLVTLVA